MTRFLTVIISDHPLAQREGLPGIIETRAVDLSDDPETRAAEIAAEVAALAAAAAARIE